jgi:hypothetical protein
MAEVLPLPMQSSSTITMLHSRPSSSEAFQGPQQQSPRLGQAPRSMYNGSNNTAYKNQAAPVQPYAFQATPNLRQESRTISAPNGGQNLLTVQRAGHSQSASSSTTSSDASSAKDDSVIGNQTETSIDFSSSPDLTLNSYDQLPKPSPDRYRRAARRTNSNNSVPRTTPNGAASPTTPFTSVLSPPSPTIERTASSDSTTLPRSGNTELAKRYRRRSLNTIDVVTPNGEVPAAPVSAGAQRPSSSHGGSASSTSNTIRPVGSHQRTSSRDGPEIARRNGSTASDSSSVKANDAPTAQKSVNVPPRGASDPNKRMAAPSPLSRQTSDNAAPAAIPTAPRHRSYASVTRAAVHPAPSAAAQHLAAVSDRDLNKGMKSRLRRAFSFGSAQELRRAESNAAATPQPLTRGEQPTQRPEDELDPEQLEIARRQEAAGIGANIYSGQGGFTGSTDNISISSTASSASMMLRKMGKGAKKSARSIKGLFRPKSVIGVPAADGPVNQQRGSPLQPSVAQVSMVTVEAERQKVNVNAELDDKSGGATGFPKLELNSMDAMNNGSARPSAEGSDSLTRRSIVGSDKDRAEVLAAVKKGILKRSGTSSPIGSPDIRPSDSAPHVESPVSSMPSTPKDGSTRSASFRDHVNQDYFNQPRIASMTNTRSMPATPTGGKGITFSPRIQFHDAWSASDYDRRGDIATCNRLTPILAQQIKEELNTFKMVRTILGINVFAGTNYITGDGSPRTEQAAHTLLLMIHHTFTRRPQNHRITKTNPTLEHLISPSLDTHKELGSNTTPLPTKFTTRYNGAQSTRSANQYCTLRIWLKEQKQLSRRQPTISVSIGSYQSPSCRYCSLKNFLEYFTCSCLSGLATAAEKPSSNWTTKRLHLGKLLLSSFLLLLSLFGVLIGNPMGNSACRSD